ncbi:MAG: hypothetical protein RL026_156 [Pseudomonadota bacterium]
MLPLLPRNAAPALHGLAGLPAPREAAGYDLLLQLLPPDTAPDPRLPDAPRWVALQQREATRHGDVRTTVLQGETACVAGLGWCRSDASTYEVLATAGKLVKAALSLLPRPRRIGLHVPQGTPSRRALWQEALHAAVAAQLFELPSAKTGKSAAALGTATRVDVFAAAPGLDLKRCTITAEAGNLVRHLVSLPPNVLDAAAYRKLLTELARQHGLSLKWHSEASLQQAGAGAFLAVSRANASRTAGIAQLGYRPSKGSRRKAPDVALVGKGILFDTGGINLKPHRSMLDMHTDMAGSAVALASLVALARLGAPLAAEAWLAITENNIGPTAYRPQEIVRASNGTTIQVIHSDAEGRMVLADTLALASRRKPGLIVDYATLTGACVHALTERMSGVFSNRTALLPALHLAGTDSGERVWAFPLDEDYDSDLDSQVADIAQCAVEGKGDHILAARFLGRFVPADTAWVHMDLSSATRRGGLAHVTTEATGFGVRFTLALLLDQELPQA